MCEIVAFTCLWCSPTTSSKLLLGPGLLWVCLLVLCELSCLIAFLWFSLPLDSKKQSYNLQVMQHLPVPATGAAHSLDGWYHRGSPPSLHARVRYWPAKWGRSQNAAVNFHFPHHFILSEFRRKWTHVQNTIHCETWSSWIFFVICISELLKKIFFSCFLHGPCEREDALHTSALHQHLTKM